MHSIAYGQIVLLIFQCVLVATLLLFLFRLRSIFGLGLLFTALGIFQYMQVFLAASLYIEVVPGIFVSPGSAVLFSGSLFAILLIYIREDALEARKVIYAILAANLVLTLLQLVFSWTLEGEGVKNIYNLPKELFTMDARVLLVGSLALFIDSFLVIIVFETISKFISLLYFRILFTMMLVLSFDSLFFSLGAFGGTNQFNDILLSGLLSKNSAVFIYSALFTLYLMYVDKGIEKTEMNASSFKDIFYSLTYRQKYEDVYKERNLKSVELEKSDAYNRLLFEKSAIGLVLTRMDGKVVDVNSAYASIIGRTIEESLKLTYWDITPGKYAAEEEKQLHLLKTKGKYGPYEKEYIHKDGHLVPVRLQGQIIERNGEKYILSSVEDIATRKKAEKKLEESEKRFRLLYENAPLSYQSLDEEGRLIDVNSVWLQTLGYTREEVIGKYFGEFMTKESAELIKIRFPRFKAEGEIKDAEFKMLRKDGSSLFISYEGKIGKDEFGNFKQTHCIFTDITARKEAENEIRESELRYQTLANISPVGIFRTDCEGSTTYVNPRWCQISGMTAKDGMEYGWLNGVYSEDKEKIINRWESVVKTNLSSTSEYRFVHPDGMIRWVMGHVVPEYNSEHKIVGYVGTITDITELKKASEEIIQSNEELDILNKIIVESSSTLELNKTLDKIMDEAVKIVGLEGGTICLLNPDDTFDLVVERGASQETIEDLSMHKIKVGDCLCGNCAKECRSLILHTKEEVISYATREVLRGEDIRFHAAFPFVINEKCVGVLCVFTRTDTKPTERSLKLLETIVAQATIFIENARLYEKSQESEERFRTIVEKARNVIYIISPDGKLRIINPAFEQLTGWSREEWIGQPFAQLVHPDDLHLAIRSFKNVMEGKIIPPYELRIRCKSGEYKIGEFNPTPLISGKNIVGALGIATDVTERKKAEEKIKKSEALYHDLVETSQDLIWQCDVEGRYSYLNPAWEEVFGYTVEEMLGKKFSDFQTPGYAERDKKQFARLLKGDTVKGLETVHLAKDGTEIELVFNAKVLIGVHGNVAGTKGTAHDFTELKKAERKIIKSNRIYAFISQINQAIVHIRDRDVILKEACTIAIEFGKFQMAWVGLVDEETPHVNPFSFAGVEDGYLSVIKKISSGNDPSGHGPTGNSIREGKHFVCNDIENDPSMALWKDEALKREYRSSIALPIKVFGKVIGAFNLYSSVPHFFDLEEIDLLDEVTNDISFALESIEIEKKRKIAVDELKQSEYRFHTAFANAATGITLTAPNGELLQVNNSFCQMLGYTEEELLNSNFTSITHPDDLLLSKDYIDKAVAGGINTLHFEKRYLRKNGETMWAEISSSLLRDANEKPLYFIAQVIDITERKKAEDELKTKNTFIQTVLDNLPIGVALNSINEGSALYMNKKFEEIYGWPRVEMEDIASFFEKVYPDKMYREELMTRILSDIQSGEASRMHWEDCRVIHKDGSEHIINAVNIPLFEQNSMVSTVIDITEIKKAEVALRESEEKFAKAFQASPEIILLTSLKDGRILEVNDRLSEITGYTSSEVLGKTTTELNFWKDSLQRDEFMEHLQKNGNVRDYEFGFRIKSGKILDTLISCEIIQLQDDKYILGVIRDITDHKRIQMEIQQLNTELEQRVKERTEELEHANKELEEINDLFVGREMRIIELKETIEKLKNEINLK